jgi:hypothetical protein
MEESGEEEGSEEVIEGGSNQIEEESKVMADGGPEEPKINANKKGKKNDSEEEESEEDDGIGGLGFQDEDESDELDEAVRDIKLKFFSLILM